MGWGEPQGLPGSVSVGGSVERAAGRILDEALGAYRAAVHWDRVQRNQIQAAIDRARGRSYLHAVALLRPDQDIDVDVLYVERFGHLPEETPA